MRMKFFTLVLISLMLSSYRLLAADMQSAEGLLKYYPPDVQSSQAWYGHNFMLGTTPLQPSAAFPADVLLRYVGKHIKVTGVWQAGKVFKPDESQQVSAMPLSEADAPVVRNDGILVQTITVLKKP